jgi:Xaa-Pro aminopeptidase
MMGLRRLRRSPRRLRQLSSTPAAASALAEVEAPVASPVGTTPAVSALQELLCAHGLAAYIVPTADAHNSEYVADVFKRRVFISGFTGSAGTAVVLADADDAGHSAYLWTDSRYWIQAEQQLREQAEPGGGAGCWGLIKAGGSGGPTAAPTIEEFLAKQLAPGSKVGVDPLTLTYVQGRQYRRALEEAQVSLVSLPSNLVDEVWGAATASSPPRPGRFLEVMPSPPRGGAVVQPVERAGLGVAEKLVAVRDALAERGASATVVTALDEVMWLFNIRGSPGDVEFNPVLLSYALVTVEPPTAALWIDINKLTPKVAAHLSAAGVACHEYDAAVDGGVAGEGVHGSSSIVGALCAAATAQDQGQGQRVLLDTVTCNLAIYERLLSCSSSSSSGAAVAPGLDEGGGGGGGTIEVVEERSCLLLPKALKQPAEVRGYYACHRRDGAALTAFLCWLEQRVVVAGERGHTE